MWGADRYRTGGEDGHCDLPAKRLPSRPLNFGIVAIVLTLACAACSGRGGSTHTASAKAHFTVSQANTMASQVTSADVQTRQQVLVPQLASQVGTTPLLKLGTTPTINPSTFKALGPAAGTVSAITTGSEPGRWTLYVVFEGGSWRLVDAETAVGHQYLGRDGRSQL